MKLGLVLETVGNHVHTAAYEDEAQHEFEPCLFSNLVKTQTSEASLSQLTLLGLFDAHVHVSIMRTSGPWCVHISALNIINTSLCLLLWSVFLTHTLPPSFTVTPSLPLPCGPITPWSVSPSPSHSRHFLNLLSEKLCLSFFLLIAPFISFNSLSSSGSFYLLHSFHTESE